MEAILDFIIGQESVVGTVVSSLALFLLPFAPSGFAAALAAFITDSKWPKVSKALNIIGFNILKAINDPKKN